MNTHIPTLPPQPPLPAGGFDEPLDCELLARVERARDSLDSASQPTPAERDAWEAEMRDALHRCHRRGIAPRQLMAALHCTAINDARRILARYSIGAGRPALGAPVPSPEQAVILNVLAAEAAERRTKKLGSGVPWSDNVIRTLEAGRIMGLSWRRLGAALGTTPAGAQQIADRSPAPAAQTAAEPWTVPLAYTPTAEDEARIRAQYLGDDTPT